MDESSLSWITPQVVGEALAGSRHRDRAIILRRVIDGWTYSDIGEELGISRQRVVRRMGKALYRLRCAVDVEAGRTGGR
ncbi:sigma factor-like helix-turn-helix DNA-binding protein [Sphingosinithalassobacter sp. CS137]|uniref:sigma factor-like helix-turn-helix DNA-binding protein n=1 Tax=Sphingosinithalassobacter sp. CS137 TaxID=2762748 RepID=UPI00165EAE1F